MRAIRNLLWFVLGIGIAAAFMIPDAYAQTAHVDPAFNRMLNGIVSNTPGVITQSIPSGVTTMGSGTSTVTTASGLRIPVPASATATVSNSAIAKGVSKLVKGGNALGIALLALDVYTALLENPAFTACPAPDYLCKKHVPTANDSPYNPTDSGWYGIAPCVIGATCSFSTVVAATVKQGCGTGATLGGYGAMFVQSGPVYTVPLTCMTADGRGPFGAGMVYKGTLPSPADDFPPHPLTESTLEQSLLDAIASDPALAKKYYDALREDVKKKRILDGTYKLPDDTPLNFPPDTPIILPPDSPLSVHSPNVWTPEKITKTETKVMSDGSSVVEITKSQTTVNPVISGTTVGDTKITYPTTTTETKTATNTSTGNVTTTTTVINESPQVEPSKSDEPVDPCKTNPDRAGCALLGTPPPAQEIPSQDIPISVTPVPFASAAGCPADYTFQAYGARSISNQPLCDTMTKFRPLILALASLTAAIVFMCGLKL